MKGSSIVQVAVLLIVMLCSIPPFFVIESIIIPRRFVGYEMLIKAEEHSEYINVVGSGKDETGVYIKLENPIENDYPIGSEVRLSDAEYYSEIKGSLDDFEAMGFNVKHFTYPYNANDEVARELVSEYYYSGRASGGVNGYEEGVNLPHEPLKTYALYSVGIDRASEEKIESILDETVREKALSIVYFHSDRTTERRIKYLIDTAMEKEIDILTRSEAFNRFVDSENNFPDPALVIEYDDSPGTDYTLAFYVHQYMQDKYGEKIPGNIAAVSGRFSETRDDRAFYGFWHSDRVLTKEQMQEMVDDGWEVVSHSRSHAYLKSVLSTNERVNTNDDKIYVARSF